jgi:hypothetical protein
MGTNGRESGHTGECRVIRACVGRALAVAGRYERTLWTLVALSLLVFADIRFLYVSRLRRGRVLHLVLGGAWGAACVAALFLEPGFARTALVVGSLT